jgi:hypothetical protein
MIFMKESASRISAVMFTKESVALKKKLGNLDVNFWER